MRLLFLLLAASVSTHCAEESFHGSHGVQPAEGRLASDSQPIAAADESASDGTSSETSSSPVHSNIEPGSDEGLTEPVMVGGTFLVCQAIDAIHCRIDSQDEANITVDQKLSPQFFVDGAMSDFERSTREDWRWQIDASIVTADSIALHLLLNGQTAYRYTTSIVNQPLQIGDGTSELQGCSNETVREALLTGIRYDRSFTLDESSSVAVVITGLCGIARANDSKIELIDAAGAIQETVFLPRTPSTIDFHYHFEALASGTYTLRISAGDDLDIDDLFINGLSISPTSPTGSLPAN